MTPEEARRLLDGTTPGKWQWDVTGNVAAVDGDGWEDVADYVAESNAPLIVAAPDMAAMIAGMREEWGVAVTYPGLAEVVEWGFDTRDGAEAEGSTLAAEYRIVRRYVTTPEEA